MLVILVMCRKKIGVTSIIFTDSCPKLLAENNYLILGKISGGLCRDFRLVITLRIDSSIVMLQGRFQNFRNTLFSEATHDTYPFIFCVYQEKKNSRDLFNVLLK